MPFVTGSARKCLPLIPLSHPLSLAGGVLQLVATDHAVFNSTQKAVGRHDFRVIPNGVNGLEERLHVVWQEMVVPGDLRICYCTWTLMWGSV